jgi:hypothetical protein
MVQTLVVEFRFQLFQPTPSRDNYCQQLRCPVVQSESMLAVTNIDGEDSKSVKSAKNVSHARNRQNRGLSAND